MSSHPPEDGNYTFRAAFDSDEDLRKFGPNSLSIFTLMLYLRIEDPDEFAVNAITEGPDDKKVDFCHIDEQERRIIIGQSYLAREWTRQSAPSNKASDLASAVAWFLSASEDLIPSHLVDKAREIRRSIQSHSITRVELLFIHNCNESVNVDKELKAVADAARDIIVSMAQPGQEPIIVSYKEIGLNEIEDLYRARESEILVDDIIEVPLTEYIREQADEWRAILASVPAEWIKYLYKQHGDRLFSANYRDYLGYASKNTNINFQINQTATSEPRNFWVYNNGITALTHQINLSTPPTIRGISIINGAQTSGALGDTTEPSAQQAKVLIRIVECENPELIDKIIRYNNTQNEIKPADRRSNDATQRRLRADFEQYGITYVHRRTASRAPRNSITASSIAPALCAFHGDPQTAYRNSRDIFNDDAIYQRVFPNNLRVEHIFLIKTLSIALDSIKEGLKIRHANQTTTQIESQEYEVLKYSASKHFLFYIIGSLSEQLMGRRISDRFEWKCRRDVIVPNNISMIRSWIEVLQAILPQLATIIARRPGDPFYDVPRSSDQSRLVSTELIALIASLQSQLVSQFSMLRDRTTI
jgi:hypothetical protein